MFDMREESEALVSSAECKERWQIKYGCSGSLHGTAVSRYGEMIR